MIMMTAQDGFFIGEIILESLTNWSCLATIEKYVIKKRVAQMPNESVPVWNIYRYRLPRAEVQSIRPVLESSFVNGEWYIHFFSEVGEELFVIMKGRSFLLPKVRNHEWDEMIQYGESVGVGRRWTESIPVVLHT